MNFIYSNKQAMKMRYKKVQGLLFV